MVLNLDHLEDSSIEVLLHELRKAEKAVAAGEEPPETYAAAAAPPPLAGQTRPTDGNCANARAVAFTLFWYSDTGTFGIANLRRFHDT